MSVQLGSKPATVGPPGSRRAADSAADQEGRAPGPNHVERLRAECERLRARAALLRANWNRAEAKVARLDLIAREYYETLLSCAAARLMRKARFAVGYRTPWTERVVVQIDRTNMNAPKEQRQTTKAFVVHLDPEAEPSRRLQWKWENRQGDAFDLLPASWTAVDGGYDAEASEHDSFRDYKALMYSAVGALPSDYGYVVDMMGCREELEKEVDEAASRA